MKRVSLVSFVVIFAAAALAQTQAQGQHRDLDIVTDSLPPAKAAVPVKPTIPRSYALVVGISNYKNLPTEAQLKYPDRDADLIYSVLISKDGGQFPPENVHLLKNQDATLVNVKRELETWLPSVSTDDDRVLIYFAGHGFLVSGTSYLATYDIDRNNIAGTAYPMARLGEVVGGKIKGKWKVLLADACHSGAITPESDRAQINQSILDLNKSMFAMTASRDREQSFEGAGWGGGHGIFTYYVVKGLQGEADTTGDGVVSADELAEYVHSTVREATSARQNPTYDHGSFDSGMVLAYNPNRASTASVQKLQVGTLVIETNMDGVDVMVDGKSVGIVNKAQALRLPGLQPGAHTIQANHEGYQPDGPREEQIYPGQETTVSLHILIARQRKKAAVDQFNRGMEYYNKGYEQNYKVAVDSFSKALQIDPTYSQAALYLGRCYRSLFDYTQATQFMKQAIDIQPDYMDAHMSYAAALLDTGDFDEAIRQLTFVTQRDPNQGTAWYLLSQAYSRKGVYKQAIPAARQAIKLTPSNAEAHFWLADSLRLNSQAIEAESEYGQYLALSNYESGLGGKLSYYVMPYLIGFGSKKRAAQTDIWKELRGQANFGLCDCAWLEKRLDPAITYCRTALTYNPQDLFAHYRLGILYSQKFNVVNAKPTAIPDGLDLLVEARKHFGAVITLNADASESTFSKKYIQNIDSMLQQQR